MDLEDDEESCGLWDHHLQGTVHLHGTQKKNIENE